MAVFEKIYSFMVVLILTAAVLVPPLYLTAVEIKMLCYSFGIGKGRKNSHFWDLVTIFYGIICNLVYLSFLKEVYFDKNWTEVLVNRQKHAPIHTDFLLTIGVILLVALIGYFVLSAAPIKKTPPLVLVTGLSAVYLGTALSFIWLIQIFRWENILDLYLLLLPFNTLFISIRLTREKCKEWRETEHSSGKIEGIPLLRYLNRFLMRSETWPIAAFLLMWPLLGITIALLWLFGQEPDAVIKAWTETSDWNLSQRMAPQNVYYDEHYLCTVAAGGHEEIVKPLRLGVRHGHEVIVNRQLCVANAFEQILEEKTPRFHKKVRGFYDRYGFPVAKLIRTKTAADVVYLFMKPLEWIFLIVLYLVDVNPENRIAVQYTGKKMKDFQI